jgi:hypothetical protein
MTIPGVSYPITYDISYAGNNPSGTFIGLTGTYVPFTSLVGTTPCVVTLTDPVLNRVAYPFTIINSVIQPAFPRLTVIGGYRVDLSTNVVTAYTRFTTGSFTLSGDTGPLNLKTIYSVSGISGQTVGFTNETSYPNPNSSVRTITYNLSGNKTYVYGVSITDQANNNITPRFNLYIDTLVAGQPRYTISGSTNPNASTSVSGGAIYTNVSGGNLIISLSGEAGALFDISYNGKVSSGTLDDSGGFASFTNVLDGSNTFLGTFRDIAGNQSIYPFIMYYTTKKPLPPVLTVSGSPSVSLSGGAISVYSKYTTNPFTLSGGLTTLPVDVQYTVSGPNLLYIDSTYNPNTQVRTASYNVLGQNTYTYTVSIADRAENIYDTSFNLTVITVPPILLSLSVSGSTNPNATINDSGQTIYTNASGVILNISLSGAIGNVLFDVSYNGKRPSGTILNGAGSLSISGLLTTNACVLTLVDAATNASIYPFTIQYSDSLPAYPTFTVSDSTIYLTSSNPTVYTNVSSGIITFLGDPNILYAISHTGGIDPSYTSTSSNSFSIPYNFSDSSYSYFLKMTNILNTNTRDASFTLVVDTQIPDIPYLSVSNVVNGYTKVGISGCILTVSGEEGAKYFLSHTIDGIEYQDGSGQMQSSLQTIAGSTLSNVSTDGSYNFTVYLIDRAGNQGNSYSVSFIVDTQKPEPPVLYIYNSQYSSLSGVYTNVGISGCTFSISGEPEAFYTLSHTLNGSSSIQDASGTLPLSGVHVLSLSGSSFIDGLYIFSVSLTDTAGNTSDVTSMSFVVDTINPFTPSLSISNVMNGYTKVGISACILTVSGESGATYFLSHTIHGIEYQDGSGQMQSSLQTISGSTLSNVSTDGSYNFEVYLIDRAGNQSSTYSTTFIVDTIVPPQPTFSISGGTTIDSTIYTSLISGILNISGSPSEVDTIFTVVEYPEISGTLVEGLGGFVFSNLVDGPNTFSLLFTDVAQNTITYPLTIQFISTLPAYPLVLVSGVPIRSSQNNPVIYTDASQGSITLSGDTSTRYTVYKNGQLIPELSNILATDGRLTFEYASTSSVELFTYSFQMVNLANIARDASFVLCVDTDAPSRPTLSLSLPVVDSSSCSFTISGEILTSYYIFVDGSNNYSSYPDPSYSYAVYYPVIGMEVYNISGVLTYSPFPITLTNLGDGMHTITAYLRDIAGNPSLTHYVEVRIDTVPPEQPVITLSQSLTNSSGCTITISGEQFASYFIYVDGITEYVENVEPSDGYIVFTSVLPYFSVSGVMTESVITIPLIGLLDGYHTIQVYIRDVAGNASTVASSSIEVDLQSPEEPAIMLSQSLTNSSGCTITISGEQFASYFIYVDGLTEYVENVEPSDGYVMFASVLPYFSISGLMTDSIITIPLVGLMDGSHTIQVYLRDAAGNASTVASKSIEVDLQSPLRPSFSLTNTLTNISGCTFTISGENNTNYFIYVDGETNYSANVEPSGGYVIFTEVPDIPIFSVSGRMTSNRQIVSLSGLLDGSHNITVYLRDAAGNASESFSRELYVDLQAPESPVIAIADPNENNLSGTTTHYSTATLTISGELYSRFRIRLNGVDISSGILTTTISYALTNLSGAHTVSVTLTDPAGNVSIPSSLSWTVNRYSTAPQITLFTDSSRNTLRVGVSGEVGTDYRILLSGANVLSFSGQIVNNFTIDLSNLSCGQTNISVILTNYAGYSTTSTASYIVPMILSASGTVISWNGITGSYTIYRVNTGKPATSIVTQSAPSYNASPYSGLTMTFYVTSPQQTSINTITLTLPTNTQETIKIPIEEYISAGLNGDTSGNLLKTIYNTYDASAYLVVVPSGLTKILSVSGIADSAFAMVIVPTGLTINLPSNILLGVPYLYLAGDPGTTKIYTVDGSYSVTVLFGSSNITIDNIQYPVGSKVQFGPLSYNVVGMGSAFLSLIVKQSFVVPVIPPFNTIRNNRSYYDVDYILSEQDRIETLRLQSCSTTTPCKKQFKSYSEKSLATRNNIITKCYKPDEC